MHKLKTDMNIGHNIRCLRLKTGLTQDQVVAQMQLYGCKLSRVTYAKIEGNNYNIRISELLAMREIFNATLDDFFSGLNVQRTDSPKSDS